MCMYVYVLVCVRQWQIACICMCESLVCIYDMCMRIWKLTGQHSGNVRGEKVAKWMSLVVNLKSYSCSEWVVSHYQRKLDGLVSHFLNFLFLVFWSHEFTQSSVLLTWNVNWYTCVYPCVWERERESVRVCIYVHTCMCMYVWERILQFLYHVSFRI